MFAAPAGPLQTSADGTDLDQHAVLSELSPSLLGDNAPHPSSVAAPASSAVILDKDSLGAIPPALPVHNGSVARQMDSGPQAPSAVPHSAPRVAGNNRTKLPVVPAAPPLLHSPSQKALPSLLPSGLISSRTRRRRAAAAGKFQAAVDYGFNRSDPTPRPAPIARKPHPPRNAPPSQVAPGPSVNPVPAMPIQQATDAASPAPPLLGALPPEAPRRVSTPAALPEMPSPAEIEFIESVARFSDTDWAREQREEPICDAAIRYLLLRSPAVLPRDFLLHLAPHKRPPLAGVRSSTEKGRLCADYDGILLLMRKTSLPGLSRQAWRVGVPPLTR